MTAGILLAAGESRRMGATCKLLLPVDGDPLVRVAAGALVEAGLSPLIAVLGWRAKEVAGALAGLPLACIANPRYTEGMGTSLATGVAALPATADHVVVALGDMPCVRPATIRTLILFCQDRGVAAPVYRGRRGHPVVFNLSRYRDELTNLVRDHGARTILEAHPEDLALVAVDDPGVLLDLDTPQEYEAWLRRRQGPVVPGVG